MKVRIYQINKKLDTENALFMGFDFAEKHGGVDPLTYSWAMFRIFCKCPVP